MSYTPEIPWIEASETPWGVRVLDVSPVTLHMISTSADPQCAANALSFRHDDGSAFEGVAPRLPRIIGAMMRYRTHAPLPDGALFRPEEMEHKWAIFHRQSRIFFVRSWTREVRAIAELSPGEGYVEVKSITGVFASEDEPPLFTTMVADFLLRSHALGMTYPAPLREGWVESPAKAALWCFQMYGNQALLATDEIIPISVPEGELKVLS